MNNGLTRWANNSSFVFTKKKSAVPTAIALLAVVFLLWCHGVYAQQIIKLYPDSVPNARVTSMLEEKSLLQNGMYSKVLTPTLEVYLPEKDKASGAAVIICPGGGYSVIVYQGEGITNAKEMAKNGVSAFVLKYRLPNDSLQQDKSIAPLQDAQQAIKLVRERASEWGIDVNKIGIMGFSAGGHLAATEATHFNKALIKNTSNTSLRPDFQILVYPVISMQDSLTHGDSRRKLLGSHPTKEQINLFSNELQVDKDTPPTYLTHTTDDITVDVDNSIAYFQHLRHNKVPVEMHIYPKGGHGFIFRQKGWIEPLLQWMRSNKWVKN